MALPDQVIELPAPMDEEDVLKVAHDVMYHEKGNVAQSWQWREMGQNVSRKLSNKTMLEHIAEEKLVYKKDFNLKYCDLPGYPRSTFLMVFSPDGKTMASTHGNHNIYLTELSSGKHIGVLKGHPRTPWCVEFHPSYARIVGSGCLGGQVRVWDLSGGSEVWTVSNGTEIASIAFHPRDQLLVIATYNELYFWDWSQPAPFTKVCTNNYNEKVRYVAFDSLGNKLITGISVWASSNRASSIQQPTTQGDDNSTNNNGPPGPSGDSPESPGESNEDIIANSYDLVQRYDSLVRNYHRLYLARTQAAANRIDRGTDPMEVDSFTAINRHRAARLLANNNSDSNEPLRRTYNLLGSFTDNDNRDSELTDRPRDPDSQESELTLNDPMDASRDGYLARLFGSRTSAFEPLTENSYQRRYAYRTHYPTLLHRVLPNPFSSLAASDSRNRLSRMSNSPTEDNGALRSLMDEIINSTSSSFMPVNSMSGTRNMNSQRHREVNQNNAENLRSRPSFELFPFEDESTRSNVLSGTDVSGVLRRRALNRLLDSEQITAADAGAIRETVEPNRSHRESTSNMHQSQRNNESTSNVRTDESGESSNVSNNYSLRSPELMQYRLSDLNLFDNVQLPIIERNQSNDPNLRRSGEPIDLTTSLRQSTAATSRPLESQSDQNDATMSITQSLDIIRDILRDSGTRLLNLITDMSYSTLASVNSRSGNGRNQRSYVDGEPSRTETNRTQNINFLGNTSSSETDSDHSLEVNIYRSRNATFSENSNETTNNNNQETARPTNRMVVNLDLVEQLEPSTVEPNSFTHTMNSNTINITVTNNRFRLRTNNSDETNIQTDENQPQRAATSTTSNTESNLNTDHSITLSFPVDSSITGTLSFPAFGSSASNSTTFTFQNSSTPSTSSTVTTSATSILTTSVADCISSNTTQRQTSIQNVDVQIPSTSRDSDTSARTMSFTEQQAAQDPIIAEEALRKVKLGIEALQRHTSTLTDMWLRGTRTSMKDLRTMWEDLRRQIIILHRQTGQTESSVYFARGLLERCHMLTNLSRKALNRTMDSLRTSRNDIENPVDVSLQDSISTETASTSPSSNRSRGDTNENSIDMNQPSTSRDSRDSQHNLNTTSDDSIQRMVSPVASVSRRLFKRQVARGQRMVQRMRQYRQHARASILKPLRQRESARSIELHLTRHEIRVRAMQVLSMMFNVMMSCLEEGELSTHITVMLRTLKRALGVTCLLLMTNNRGRENSVSQLFRRRNSTSAGVEQQLDPEVGERTNQPLNESDNQIPSTSREMQQSSTLSECITPETNLNTNALNTSNPLCSNCSELKSNFATDINTEESNKPTSSTATISNTTRPENVSQGSSKNEDEGNSDQQSNSRWSNRLAVNISDANRNLSDTANKRRQIYLQRKRMKALHRCNPTAHPLIKRKYQPVVTHRIPSPRNLPARHQNTNESYIRIIPSNISNEPLPGPSNSQNSAPPNVPLRNNPEVNAGYMRFAQRQAAARLHIANRTRNRFRIRLYTPSSVREMFDILTTSPNERESEPPSPNNLQEASSRRSFSYRPQILAVRNNLESLNPGSEGSHPFRSTLNMSVPRVQVNSVPVSVQSIPPNPSRVREYQPIVLAQEAVGGGLLEAGLISEMAVQVHRVQAWDFTSGDIPDIKNNKKNVVVARCKIHNDASIDISRDGTMLVALLPMMNRTRNFCMAVGVYSLEWSRLGTCLHNVGLTQSAVSVSFSPTARYLAAGLGVRRVTTLPVVRNNNSYAMLINVPPEKSDKEMTPVRVLDHNWETGFTSLNCLRWAPVSGQGLLYANNTGQLIILS